ncbi:threonine/serine exporter family protein [Brotaphodocola sp.]|uniref:threonine/serine exporter family protein n=1 Tax=Brotaphodocola sp. TaxID=3073577 RepID=UPI003D7F1209
MILHLLTQTISASIATVGFSLLFGVPSRYYPCCALIGGVSWLAYLLILPYSSVSIATFASTVIVILMSRWFAVRERCPVTIFLISGIIPLVPGAGIYRATYYMVTEQLHQAVQTGFESVKVAVAIVLGIVFVFEIPQKVFQFGTNKTHSSKKQ